MALAEASFSQPSPVGRSAVWPWLAATGGLGGIGAIAFLLLPDEALSYTARCVCFLAGYAIEIGLFWAASRRDGISGRLALALRLLAATAAIGFAIQAYAVGTYVQFLPEIPTAVWDFCTLLSYVTSLAAVCSMPMFPLSRQQWQQYFLDSVMSVGGVALIYWVLFAPVGGIGAAPAYGIGTTVTSGIELLLVLLALGLLMIRGRAEPSRLALWLFLTAKVFTCGVVVLLQLSHRVPALEHLGDASFLVAQGLLISAGLVFWRDPVHAPLETPTPAWLLAFNPIPVLLIAVVAGLTGTVNLLQAPQRQLPLAIGLVVLVLLMTVRIVMTAREHARLVRAEALAAQRLYVEKMSGVGRLAGGIAHEFNNLLMTVTGHAELGLQSGSSQADVQQDLKRILGAADRAAALTQQLVSFSGKGLMSLERVVVSEWLRQIEPGLRQRLPGGVKLEIEAPHAVGSIQIDRAQIHGAIAQLISNAIDAMPSGGSISVSAWTETLTKDLQTQFLSVPAGRYVVLELADTGSGIPESHLPEIFDPFFSSKPAHAAAGLGLASVYGAIAAHRGGIVVHSRVGHGTSFKLYFPSSAS
ncbi:MAG: ATP-binding protein [Acidobacteriota bacterium]